MSPELIQQLHLKSHQLKMSKSFNEISQEIANDFLQNIVFIDDNAYTDKKGNAHDFDALEITKEFSHSEKFCAVYKPVVEEDIEKFSKIAKKADVQNN
jgi:hypothetical protein